MRLRAEGVSRRYFRKTGEANFFEAVKKTDLILESGKVTVLMGRSGGGKTTLLHMLGGLLQPTEGKVWLEEDPPERAVDLYALTDGELSRLRNGKIAVISQGRSAIDTLSVRENLLLPGAMYGQADAGAEKRAEELMARFGIAHLADSSPKELSGGELRRMVIARALCGKPEVILADEPTGDLDDENTGLVLETLKEAARDGAAVLIVTHEGETLKFADECFRMDAGEIRPLKSAPA